MRIERHIAVRPRGGFALSRHHRTMNAMSGIELAIYRRKGQNCRRKSVDTRLAAGHTLIVADLDGDNRNEIIGS